jgi:nucleoside transporter
MFYALLSAPSYSLSNAITLHHIEDQQRDFPRIRVWGTVGWIVAGLLIGLLDIEITAIPLRIAAGTSIFLSFFCLFLPKTPPLMQQKSRSLYAVFGLDTLQFFKSKSLLVLVVSVALITIPSNFYYTFTNPFLNELGVEHAASKMTLGQAVEVVIMLLMPFCFRWLGVKRMLFLGLLAWAARYTLFAFGDNQTLVWMLYGGILLHGVSYNFTALAAQIEVDRVVPKEYRGSAQGFLTLIKMGLGAFIGSLTAGMVVTFHTLENGTHNWWSIWTYPAVFSLLVALGFWLLFPGRKKRYKRKGQ